MNNYLFQFLVSVYVLMSAFALVVDITTGLKVL